MTTWLATVWMAAALGQPAPPESSWLNAVPADMPVVVRARSAGAAAKDLRAMLKAMSPGTDEEVAEAIAGGVEALEGTFGSGASGSPFLVLARFPDAEAPAVPPWAVLAGSRTSGALFKGLAQDEKGTLKSLGDHESFAGKDGATWYTTGGPGWSAFSADEALIRTIGRPTRSLAAALAPGAKAKLLDGDVSVYLNLPAVHKQYAPALRGTVKDALVAQLKQDNPGPALAQSLRSADMLFAAIDAGLRSGTALVLSFDFDPSGLTLSGWATPRGASATAKRPAPALRDGALMGRLPDDLMVYFFTDDEPAPPPRPTGLAGLFARGETAEQKATAARRKALQGRQVLGFSALPVRGVGLADPTDPEAAVRASLDQERASEKVAGMEKTIEPDALTHAGFRLARSNLRITDRFVDLIQKEKPNIPNVAAVVDKLLPGRTLHAFTGTDGKLFLTLGLAGADAAKPEIDRLRSGRGTLGDLPAWKALRARFPKEMSSFVAFQAQETARVLVEGYGVLTGDANLKLPADLPKEPQFLGFGTIGSAEGYEFRLVVPAALVPVLSKALSPLADAP